MALSAAQQELIRQQIARNRAAGLNDDGSVKPRTAWDDLRDIFAQYHLTALVDVVANLVKDTDTPDSVKLQKLYESEPYKQRFPGMAELNKKVAAGVPGMVALSPAQYILQEDAYRQRLQRAELPAGFYDDPEDFKTWIVGGVSPDEVEARAQLAAEMTDSADESTKNALTTLYGLTRGDITAYFLDPQRMQGTLAEAERRARSARLAGAATNAGFEVDSSWRSRTEDLASRVDPKMTDAQMQGAYDTIADDSRAMAGLNARHGTDFSIEDSEDANLLGLASAQRKRQKLDEAERATFKGGSGLSNSSLATRTAGNL